MLVKLYSISTSHFTSNHPDIFVWFIFFHDLWQNTAVNKFIEKYNPNTKKPKKSPSKTPYSNRLWVNILLSLTVLLQTAATQHRKGKRCKSLDDNIVDTDLDCNITEKSRHRILDLNFICLHISISIDTYIYKILWHRAVIDYTTTCSLAWPVSSPSIVLNR